MKKLLGILSENKNLILLILAATIVWSLTMVKSGITYSYGMGFWGPNGHDGVWHMALSKSFSNGNWQMPVFAGEAIKNYHIGFDLILAVLHKFTFIPINVLYFQILPPILAVLIGLYSYKFVYTWTKDKAKAYWSTFFVYLGGSWGWLVNLMKDEEIAGESMFWSQQSISTLINPPFTLSLVLILAGLYYLLKGLEEKRKNYLVLATFLFGVLVQIKVYAGILVLAALFTSGIWDLWKRRKTHMIKIFTGSLVISILLFSPAGVNVGKTLIFKPFWFLETMMSFSDRFGWEKFGGAMVNYKLGHVWLKAILAYGLAFLIFITGNFGTRIISFFWLWRKRNIFKYYQYIDVLVVTIICTGILIPLFFVQSGTSWNTIQFMYYSLTFAGVLAGISFVDIVRRLKYPKLQNQFIELILIVLTIPTSLGVLYYHYLPLRPPAKISLNELRALDFLSKEPYGIVLTQPFDKNRADSAINNPPRSLYLYESTAYVSAFSGQPVFMEDEVNLEITGYDWVLRRIEVEKFFNSVNTGEKLDFLKENRIKYLYLIKNLTSDDFDVEADLSEIYENDEVEIYRVN